jgi:transmembrane sensor
LEEAAAWHARINDPDTTVEDWEAFTFWLEASEANLVAYHDVEDVDNHVANMQSELASMAQLTDTRSDNELTGSSQNVRQTMSYVSSFSRIQVPLVAFSLLILAALILPQFNYDQIDKPQFEQFVAAPRQSKSIAIADGSTINLNRNSSLGVSLTDHERRVELMQGEALFDVAKDKNRPFVVAMAETEIRVVGTKFNVLRHNQRITVTVAEGIVAVEVKSDDLGENIPKVYTLTAGQQLHYDHPNSDIINRPVNVDNVLAWQEGQLIYENAKLSEVIADLERYSDKTFTASASSRDILFSGVLLVDDIEASLLVLQSSLPIEVTRTGTSVSINFQRKE